MKKILLFGAIFLMSVLLSAETYTVVQIQGKARSSNGAISVGQELNDESIITITGFKDYVKLSDNKFIYGPVSNKKVKDVVSNPKLKKSKVVSASTVAPASDRSRPGVATAASRASDAKEDFEWEE